MPKATAYPAEQKNSWEALVACRFRDPGFAALYPIAEDGTVTHLLSPRMACKLFHDSVFIINDELDNTYKIS